MTLGIARLTPSMDSLPRTIGDTRNSEVLLQPKVHIECCRDSTTEAMLYLQRVRSRVLHDDGEAAVVQHLVAEREVFFFNSSPQRHMIQRNSQQNGFLAARS
eukprot:6491495-Amphidinium_carterae.7